MTQKTLVDLRTYTIAVRKMPEFLEVFDRLGMPVLTRHLGRPIGFYTAAVGHLNQVVHLWEYEDMADMERRQAARDKDPDWPAYLQATVHLVTAQENRLIRRVALPSLG
jgi:hypothetical protein